MGVADCFAVLAGDKMSNLVGGVLSGPGHAQAIKALTITA
jgi:hypothetical protein